MSVFERRVLAELQTLRDAETALEGMYEMMRRAGPATQRSFMVSLKTLDERVDRLESLLERAA